MAEISENTKDLVTSCMIQRLSTREALDYLKKNKVNVSERTFRRYKNEILKQQHTLESYGWNNVQIEQVKKIETKQSASSTCAFRSQLFQVYSPANRCKSDIKKQYNHCANQCKSLQIKMQNHDLQPANQKQKV